MKKVVLIISLIFLESNFFVRSAENVDELLAVVVFFRHGDRSPETCLPADEFCNLEHFPMGFGQLTNKGLNRQYELGQWFRNRYNDFLPTQYSSNDVKVQSSDVDRTLMSAAANLAGLYPPEGDLVWNKNLLWRPIPIHTVKRSEDTILAMKKVCPKLESLYEENLNSEFYQKINQEHFELYQYVSENTGLNVTDIDTIRFIKSVFYCYQNYNSSYIPSWADNLNQTEVDYLAGLSYARYTFTEDMKRLRTGPFFSYLVGYLDNVVNNVTDTPKFLMLSSHDTELASVMDAMGVYDNYPPGFASTVIWELRRGDQGRDYINLFYRRSEDELFSLAVSGCVFDCQYEDFKTVLEAYTVDEETWERECST